MSSCPCEFNEIEPCHPQCTCRNPMLSAGCRRCVSYGSAEQRLAAAKRIVRQEAQLPKCYSPTIPHLCNGCGAALLLENLFCEDGCSCNSPLGINFDPQECSICKQPCARPGHHTKQLFGIDYANDKLAALEQAIRNHRDARGDDRCWLDDINLYKALGEPVPPGMELALPNRDAFLKRCEQYFEYRQAPGCGVWVTTEALQKESEEKSKKIEELLADLLAATAVKVVLCGQIEKLRHALIALDEDYDMDTMASRLNDLEEEWPNWRDPQEQELDF